MIIRDISEDNFNQKNTNTYELSILIGVDSFDYMVIDGQQQVLAVKSFALESKDIESSLAGVYESDKTLQQSFRNIRVGVIHSKHALIPRRLFDPQKIQLYLQQVSPLDAHEHPRADAISEFDLQNVYALDDRIDAFVRKSIPGARIFHFTTALLEGMRRQAAYQEKHHLFLHLRSNLLFILLFEGKNLLFSNAYSFQSAKDFIYYALLAFQQFQIKPDQAPTYLSGQLVQDSEIYREAYRYIRNIQFLPPPAFFKLGPKLSQEPRHFYYGLLSLNLCG